MPAPRILRNLDAVATLARAVACELGTGDRILLAGPMGAGKTTFTRALVAALDGDPDQVTSPTFTLMHHYAARIPVIHVDAYRLADAEELAAIGFDEVSEEAVACIEWPDRVAGLFAAAQCWRLQFDHVDGNARAVRVYHPTDATEERTDEEHQTGRHSGARRHGSGA